LHPAVLKSEFFGIAKKSDSAYASTHRSAKHFIKDNHHAQSPHELAPHLFGA
jgi:hypothetical protein